MVDKTRNVGGGGGRKFYLSVFIVALTTILLIGKFLDQDNYTKVVLGVIMFYLGSNVAQKALVDVKR